MVPPEVDDSSSDTSDEELELPPMGGPVANPDAGDFPTVYLTPTQVFALLTVLLTFMLIVLVFFAGNTVVDILILLFGWNRKVY